MKTLRNIAMIIFFLTAILVVVVCCMFNYNLTPIDKRDTTKIVVDIPSGSSVKNISEILEEKGIIRNANFFYFYCKIYKVDNMKATTYELSKSMSLREIIDALVAGNSYNPNEISITFQEGINMRRVASIIAKNTNNDENDVYSLLRDDNYLDKIIGKYWFLTDVIKKEEIYYSLEGYLYPDTYNFRDKDVKVEEIFKKMLDKTESVLNNYKDEINSSKYDVHEILTLASVVELEGGADYRSGIASVFFNRLKSNMQLGSDATTYYASKIEMNERDLKTEEINNVNPYNTRTTAMMGKLPVGPIANVDESSIKAVLHPLTTDNYYFVADKYGKVYFNKTYQDHQKEIARLKSEGAWYEW